MPHPQRCKHVAYGLSILLSLNALHILRSTLSHCMTGKNHLFYISQVHISIYFSTTVGTEMNQYSSRFIIYSSSSIHQLVKKYSYNIISRETLETGFP